ncbi:ENTH/ANTH/VHS superfamily protein [Corchorus capsularis]|uniref:ENTH/ANTH/VHS superfamily protein n=1 Tax=Corchorus capsularis TaxID=210143 RepID=A0A1R3JQH5_COCAP|nr:ENTH/ANTH/VHS superfamily protein [Corchorus capsularis]
MATSNHNTLTKAYGAVKDSTNMGWAMVNSNYKNIEVAILKATKRKEKLPKEKHVRTLFIAVSRTSPRSDVYYCTRHMMKRLAKTHTWTVALKTLFVFHRAIREVDSSFIHELSEMLQCRAKGCRLYLPRFGYETSPQARDYSVWIRKYALYIEERLECFHALRYDIDKDQSRNRRLNTLQLLEQLPVLQELLQCLLACKPEGAAVYNRLIDFGLSIIANEAVKVYIAITDGILNLVDKYFEMQRQHAVKALEIYRRAANQASQLLEFFEFCKNLYYRQGRKYLKIKPLPESFLAAMEEYLKEAPEVLALPYKASKDDQGAEPTEDPSAECRLIIYPKEDTDLQGEDPSVTSSDQNQSEVKQAVAKLEIGDLLSFDDPPEQEGSQLEENNPLALALVESESGTTGWEIELFGGPSSNAVAVTENKLTGELDRLTLDSLYNQAITTTVNQDAYNFGQVSTNPFEIDFNQQQFHVNGNVIPPTDLQMVAVAQQQTYAIHQLQQQQLLNPMLGNNLFGVDYSQVPPYGSGYVISPADVQMAAMAQQQPYIMNPQQQPQPHMVGCDSTIPSANPFLEQNVPSDPPNDAAPSGPLKDSAPSDPPEDIPFLA